ncbi:MAG TPA: cation diffusion facilitator family transporter [Alphaproteobacteria bacterium]
MSAPASAPIGREDARLLRLATHASVAVAATLIVLKFGAWVLTDSVAILSSLVDSVLDSFASLVNLFAVRQALTPADPEHRFGHGKAESIAGLGQAAFIAGSALFVLVEAVARLVTPHPLGYGPVGLAVMVISIVLTFALVRFQMHVVRRTGSTAISADSLHYRSDLLVNGGIIASLGVSVYVGVPWVDPLVAIAIAGYIVYSAWAIAREALDALMDREFPDHDRQRILDIVAAHVQVKGIHDLRTRRSGLQPFVQLHLELDGSITLNDAHIISDQVEAEIMAAFPGAEVIIHQDPHGIPETMPAYAREDAPSGPS